MAFIVAEYYCYVEEKKTLRKCGICKCEKLSWDLVDIFRFERLSFYSCSFYSKHHLARKDKRWFYFIFPFFDKIKDEIWVSVKLLLTKDTSYDFPNYPLSMSSLKLWFIFSFLCKKFMETRRQVENEKKTKWKKKEKREKRKVVVQLMIIWWKRKWEIIIQSSQLSPIQPKRAFVFMPFCSFYHSLQLSSYFNPTTKVNILNKPTLTAS